MKKVTRTLLLIALGVVGWGMTTTVAEAATSSLKYLSINTEYVRTKKAMKVGIKEKINGKYQTVKVKKNTLLKVTTIASDRTKSGGIKETAGFSFGAVHYARAKNLKYADKATIPFTKTNFKRVSLKAPIRAQIFRPGTGYQANSDNSGAVATSGFYLTMDNYLQYYSQATLAKDAGIKDARWATENENYRPTRSEKVTKVTVKGNTTKIDYKKALKGLPNKKIGKNHYRLTIKNLKTTGSVNLVPVDDTYDSVGSWTNYTINGKAYYFGEIEHGLD